MSTPSKSHYINKTNCDTRLTYYKQTKNLRIDRTRLFNDSSHFLIYDISYIRSDITTSSVENLQTYK